MFTTEIRLKNQGSERIEVIDNGSGVAPANFQALGILIFVDILFYI